MQVGMHELPQSLKQEKQLAGGLLDLLLPGLIFLLRAQSHVFICIYIYICKVRLV